MMLLLMSATWTVAEPASRMLWLLQLRTMLLRITAWFAAFAGT